MRRIEAVVFHDLEQARLALAAAETAEACVHLLTPPGGGHYAGLGFYGEIGRIAAAERPGARFCMTLDCGDDPALALIALGEGWRSLILAAGKRSQAKVGEIASGYGATIHPRRPPAFDLADAADPHAACLALLNDKSAALKGAPGYVTK